MQRIVAAVLATGLFGCSDRFTETPDACGQDRGPEAGVVITDHGPVRGAVKGDVASYFAIPYAKPPVGELRWRPPEEPACWSEPIDATQAGVACTQIDDGVVIGDEDCLTLNVWAPSNRAAGLPVLPVLFYIHGGDDIMGTASDYDGSELALRGPAVVVTVNYRLNVFGWLADPAFEDENDEHASGNYGLHDQIAALRWVQANIARFGGDPTRVLLFGQSAGATNTCALMASPLAAGLFSRALMQSGNCSALAEARVSTTAANTEAALGCAASSDIAACMRDKPAGEVARVPGTGTSDVTSTSKYYPVVDGWALPVAPDHALEKGEYNHVPFIAGTTEDEYLTVLELFVEYPLTTVADYQAAVVQIFGDGAAAVLSVYPAEAYPSPRNAMAAIFGDVAQHCPTRRALRAASAAQSEPVRRYLFVYDFPSGPLAPYGAGHGLDVPFFWSDFASIDRTPTAGETRLADAAMDYLLRFADTGDPEGDGAPPWPLYDADADPYLVLGDPVGTGSTFRAAECDFWDAVTEAIGG